QILGDGRKPWRYTEDTDEAALLAAARATLAQQAEEARATDVAVLTKQRDRLVALVGEILRYFTERGHPGRPCLRTSWVREETANGWRQRLAELTRPPDDPS
ncbi:hypothetical protein ACQEUV_32920, partial [Micromonospora aurantiaca (nom. illeg.)]